MESLKLLLDKNPPLESAPPPPTPEGMSSGCVSVVAGGFSCSLPSPFPDSPCFTGMFPRGSAWGGHPPCPGDAVA